MTLVAKGTSQAGGEWGPRHTLDGPGQQSARTELSTFPTTYRGEARRDNYQGWQDHPGAHTHVSQMEHNTQTLLLKTDLICFYSTCPMHVESMPLYLLRKCISRGQVPGKFLDWIYTEEPSIPKTCHCGMLGKSIASPRLSYCY